jgi:ParB family chromosome partitioning protein
VQDEVRRGQISTGHAKILKGITDRNRQLAICKEIIARGLSVHATEAMLKQHAQAPADKEDANLEPRPSVEKTSHVLGIEQDLQQRLATRVEIKLRAKDKGQIVLTFDSNDDFERLLEVLRR